MDLRMILAIENGDPETVVSVFGHELTRCPDGNWCVHEGEWGHPCDRDEHGEYECKRPKGSWTWWQRDA